jgi:serine/threonine-protein kinase
MADILDRLKAALADRYRIERELGSGGMATVYLAEDLKHHRKVAVKVLRPELASVLGPERFLQEIEIAAQLQHPHILALYDSGDADGFLYYVMPYIEGQSLRDKLAKEGELPIGEAIRILRDVVDALDHAHKHGVVHRDIKPDNVLLTERHALVTDFGVAKAVSEATGAEKLTTEGVALGTPSYMSPEQAAADPHVDHRADIYGVGAVAYELLTGRPPFLGTTPQMILSAHMTDTPEPVSKYRESVPPTLEQLVMKCLEKKAADRWQSAEELLPQLEALATPTGGITPTETKRVSATRAPVSSKTRTAAVAAVVVVAAVTAWFLLLRPSRPTTPTLDPNTLAVLPFRITGDSGLTYLREGMVDALHAKFTGEGGPRAVDPRTTMSAWRETVEDESEDLPLEESVRLAGQLGAGLVLLGGIVEAGDQLTLSGSLHDVPGGEELVQASVAGAGDSLSALMDRLVVQLLSLEAGEAATSVQTLSGSLDAVRAYLQGQRALRTGFPLEAVRHFDRAIELDSSFALAAVGLGRAGSFAGNTNTDAGGRGARLAWELRDHLSGRDRALVTAWRGRNTPGWTSWVDRIQDAEAAVELAPDDPVTWSMLGQLRSLVGIYLGDSAEIRRGLGALDRAWELDSSQVDVLWIRVDRAMRLGDTAVVRRLGPRLVTADSATHLSALTRWRVGRALNDSVEIERARREFGRSQAEVTNIGYRTADEGLPYDDWELSLALFEAEAMTDRARQQAMEQHRKLAGLKGQPSREIALADSLIEMGFFAWYMASSHIRQAVWGPGYDSAAAEKAAVFKSSALDSSWTGVNQYFALCPWGVWAAYQGDERDAREAVALMAEIVANDGANPICLYTIEAVLEGAVAGGRSPALERLDSLMQADGGTSAASIRGGPGFGSMANFVVARLREAQGDLPRALAAIRRRWIATSPAPQQSLPAFLREEGRLAALAGDTAGAIRAYQHYLILRTDPEPVVESEVDEVRRALARLIGEPGR